MTSQTRRVLRVLLNDPLAQHYGWDLCDRAGLPSGTLYPILARLEQLGWLKSAWEDPTLHEGAGRPRRRFYWLTDDGAEQAAAALAKEPRRTFRTATAGES
jgi:PadR family transcriptional regulator PadR